MNRDPLAQSDDDGNDDDGHDDGDDDADLDFVASGLATNSFLLFTLCKISWICVEGTLVGIVSKSKPELSEMTRLPSKALNLSPPSKTLEIQGCHNMCLGVVCKFKESAKNTCKSLLFF